MSIRRSPRGTKASRILIPPKKKIAFVCSGGASKAGAFHLGVALALREQGFSFRGGILGQAQVPTPPKPMEISQYVGSSAGSMICSFLAAGYSLENIFNSYLGKTGETPGDPKPLPPLSYRKMFQLKKGSTAGLLKEISYFRDLFRSTVEGNWDELLQMKWLRTSGLFTTDGIERYLREEVLPSNRFQDYLADLFIVGTHLNQSKKIIFSRYNYEASSDELFTHYVDDVPISQACAASTAVPFVFSPYSIDTGGKRSDFIDGEIRDTLSSHVAIDAGADLVIASYTHQPYQYNKELGSLTEHGLPSLLIQSLYLLIEQKIVAHIHHKRLQRKAIESVSEFCKQQGLTDDLRRRICEIMEAELHHRMDVDTIYIRPLANDTKLFFGEHFTLSPRRLGEYVRSGFRATIETLRRYEFEDRVAASKTTRAWAVP